MLLEFRVANYLSFGQEAVFSMLASSDKANESDNVFYANDKIRLLKSAAIYGANGSGKTNFVDAFAHMRAYVAFDERMKEDGYSFTDRSFRLSALHRGRPSYFEVTFLMNGKRFRYGFEVDAKSIVSEWLFYTPSSREAMLFTRDNDGISVGSSFKEGKGLEKRTKDDRLFLSVVAQLNGKVAESVITWFRNVSVISGLSSNLDFTLHMLSHGARYEKRIMEVLHLFDVQLEGFHLKVSESGETMNGMTKRSDTSILKRAKRPTIMFTRSIYDNGKYSGSQDFDLLQDESTGTQKLFALAGVLVESLESGDPTIIDELESKLHPLITKKIIEIFNSKKSNKRNSQLIFTTHDTNLLASKCLRRDQIWFTEKDRYGCSHMYSLAEYREKPRKDASFEKDYINGRYGAVPFIGDFASILNR